MEGLPGLLFVANDYNERWFSKSYMDILKRQYALYPFQLPFKEKISTDEMKYHHPNIANSFGTYSEGYSMEYDEKTEVKQQLYYFRLMFPLVKIKKLGVNKLQYEYPFNYKINDKYYIVRSNLRLMIYTGKEGLEFDFKGYDPKIEPRDSPIRFEYIKENHKFQYHGENKALSIFFNKNDFLGSIDYLNFRIALCFKKKEPRYNIILKRVSVEKQALCLSFPTIFCFLRTIDTKYKIENTRLYQKHYMYTKNCSYEEYMTLANCSRQNYNEDLMSLADRILDKNSVRYYTVKLAFKPISKEKFEEVRSLTREEYNFLYSYSFSEILEFLGDRETIMKVFTHIGMKLHLAPYLKNNIEGLLDISIKKGYANMSRLLIRHGEKVDSIRYSFDSRFLKLNKNRDFKKMIEFTFREFFFLVIFANSQTAYNILESCFKCFDIKKKDYAYVENFDTNKISLKNRILKMIKV